MMAAGALDRGPGEAVMRLRKVGRWALMAALVVGVFWHGGVDHSAVGVVLLLVGVAWATSAFDPPHRAPGSRIGWLWLALGVYTAAQLLPLPRDLVMVLHPYAVEISDKGRGALGLAPLSSLPIALAPGDAAFQAVLYLVAGVLSLTGGATLMHRGGRSDANALLRGIIWVALISGGFWLLAHGRGIGYRMPPEARAVARFLSFRSANHQAGLMVIQRRASSSVSSTPARSPSR